MTPAETAEMLSLQAQLAYAAYCRCAGACK